MSNPIRSFAAALVLAAGTTVAAAQSASPAFTYQGELSGQGGPANGSFDLRFALFDAASGGAQVGSTLCVNNVNVVNGHFTVLLDFGNQFTSGQRYLAVEVRPDESGIPCTNPNGFTLLEPRQPLTATPQAVHARTTDLAAAATLAQNATQLDGHLPSFFLDAGNLQGTLGSAQLAGSYSQALLLSNVNNVISGSFTGSGAGLTTLNASNLAGGTLPSGRLEGAYTNALVFSNLSNQFTGAFTGSGSGLTALNASNLSGGTVPGGRLAGNYGNAVGFTNPSNQFTGTFTGSGASLTTLNAAALTSGTLPSAALGGTYSNALTLSNAANSYAGSGAALTSLNASNLTTGTLPSARLNGTYSGNVDFVNANNSFLGSHAGYGAGLTQLNATNITSGTLDAARLPSPMVLSGSNTDAIFTVTNTNGSLHSAGLRGVSSGTEWPYVTTFGVYGETNTWLGAGVLGVATDTIREVYGVMGEVYGSHGVAVFGSAPKHGVKGVVSDLAGIGVEGISTTTTSSGWGVRGESAAINGIGVEGVATNNNSVFPDASYGGSFEATSSHGAGIKAINHATTGSAHAGFFETFSSAGVALYARSTSATYGSAVEASSQGTFAKTILANHTGTTTGWAIAAYKSGNVGAAILGTASSTTGEVAGGSFTSMSNAGIGAEGIALADQGAVAGLKGTTYSNQGYGVYGENLVYTGDAIGVYGRSASVTGHGVHGEASYQNSIAIGVFGTSNGNGSGVQGENTLSTSTGAGVLGTIAAASGAGVRGTNTGTSGAAAGVHGTTQSANGYGVLGESLSTSGINYGLRGSSFGESGRGLYAIANATTGTNYGVRGQSQSTSAGAYGVYAVGDLGASGLKTFRIDHPSDPANTYLVHYSTEGAEALNAYRGTVVLDAAGQATIVLPSYFASINIDPSYTLTAVGAPMPMLHVADEIDPAVLESAAAAGPGDPVPTCRFTIAGGVPNAKVSWRIEARRNDAWARTRGMPVELPKAASERGLYQHPALFGQPASLGMDVDAAPSTN